MRKFRPGTIIKRTNMLLNDVFYFTALHNGKWRNEQNEEVAPFSTMIEVVWEPEPYKVGDVLGYDDLYYIPPGAVVLSNNVAYVKRDDKHMSWLNMATGVHTTAPAYEYGRYGTVLKVPK